MSSKARLNADKQIVDKTYVEEILALGTDPAIVRELVTEVVNEALDTTNPINEIDGGQF